MKSQFAASPQNGMAQTLLLRVPLVERDDLEVGRLRERREVGVGPGVRRIRRALCQGPPRDFKVIRLFRKYYAVRRKLACVTRQKQQLCRAADCIQDLAGR